VLSEEAFWLFSSPTLFLATSSDLAALRNKNKYLASSSFFVITETSPWDIIVVKVVGLFFASLCLGATLFSYIYLSTPNIAAGSYFFMQA
jgi:hypothetical protein